ncbi:ABC transporter substrate-binding protein [Pararhizobium sp.]|uniref:ABC transporter substrate-binding protein n=1 Tax=Pararhizobium sp. TaxID=1977563 RepID=UPI002720F227|nr:extracellular solute-binding protein [Pararhizobium sp.]MDO9417800.1 extracellular solute-binding protein [Pararhizobium sp.]
MLVLMERKTRREALKFSILAGIAVTAALAPLAQVLAAPVELRYFYRAPWPSSEIYANWMIDEWNKQNGERIHVTGASVDGETYKTKQTIELNSNNPPDIFYSWEGGRAKDVIDNGFAANLDDYYAKYGWDKSLVPAGVSLATFDGHKYFVPTEVGASVVWYRTDIYEKLGLSVPKTWDELMANAQKIKDAGIVPFQLANQKKWPSQFMWSAILVNKYGLQTYNDLIDRKIPWTDPRAVDVTAIMKDLADKEMFEPSFNSVDLAPAFIPWNQGKAAMWYQGSFNLGSFRGEQAQCCTVPMDFFPMPAFAGQQPVMSVFAEDTLMIHAKSPHKDEAAEFINWMVSKEAMTKKLEIDKPFPSRIDADLSRLSPMEQRLATAIKDAGAFTFMHVDHAISPAISDKFLDGVQGVLAGALSPEEAMQLTEDEAIKVRGGL